MPSNHRLVNLPYVGDWRPLRSLYDLVQVTVDSVLTPLMAWTRLDLYPGIFIALLNDGANEVTVTIETRTVCWWTQARPTPSSQPPARRGRSSYRLPRC
jgi:hypothetical protein